jgi:LysM repeat protein
MVERRCPEDMIEYTIKAEDTLYELAMEYNTTGDTIMKVNPGLDPNNLQIGQKIC